MKAKIPLFFFLVGLFFIFIGVSSKSSNVNPVRTKQVESVKISVSPSPTTIETVRAAIVKVVDGDTIDVQIAGQKDVVRLIGINAPEKNQCFGKEATEKAASLLGSSSIVLESDVSQGDRDKYKRLLRYVFVQKINLNEEMIRDGFAKEYTYDKPYKYQSEFKSAQIEAQENKRGLWAEGACSKSPAAQESLRPIPSSNGNYSCDCSKLCSQIATCDEAYYQLQTCGCSARDSDHDGIPCESLCK